MKLEDYYMKNSILNTKGFVQKTTDIVRKDKKLLTLKEVKDLCETLNKQVDKNGGKYVVRGRNEYKDNTTIRTYSGVYYDSDDDYYTNMGVEQDTFDKFYKIQIVYVK